MERIYDHVTDQNVAAIVIYGKSGDTKAYVDSACEKQFTTSELKNAFIKRAVIKIGEEYFIPVSFGLVSGAGAVKYTKPNISTATSADLGTLNAAKDV